MKNIDLIIYDFDGTLCNTLPDIVNSMNAVLQLNGYNTIAYEKVRSFIGSGISKLVERSVYCALTGDNHKPVNSETLIKVTHEMSEYYSQHLMDDSHLYEGCEDVLEYFKDVPQIIVSNKPLKMIEAMVKQYGIDHYFDLIVGGDTLDVCKPDPAVWELVKEKMSLPQDPQGFMVGDSVPDLAFAKVTGLTGVACTYGFNDLPVLKKEGADHFIGVLSELKNLI